MEKSEKSENIESQKDFRSKMLKLIPDLESNGLAISSVVSAYSDMEVKCNTDLTILPENYI